MYIITWNIYISWGIINSFFKMLWISFSRSDLTGGCFPSLTALCDICWGCFIHVICQDVVFACNVLLDGFACRCCLFMKRYWLCQTVLCPLGWSYVLYIFTMAHYLGSFYEFKQCCFPWMNPMAFCHRLLLIVCCIQFVCNSWSFCQCLHKTFSSVTLCPYV